MRPALALLSAAWTWADYTADGPQGIHTAISYSAEAGDSLNEGTAGKRRTSLLRVCGHGFTFNLNLICFKLGRVLPAREGGG